MSVTGRSKTADRRRTQIIRATIEAVAELGYPQASFAEIARRGGLSSTRLISYHFDDRSELMAAVAQSIVSDLAAAVGAAMELATNPRDAVHAYLRANVSYVDEHRAEMICLTALWFAGAMGRSVQQSNDAQEALAELIAAGVEENQFATVDPEVAAVVLQRAVEGLSFQLHRDPDVDLDHYGDKLVAFFDSGLATRSGEARVVQS